AFAGEVVGGGGEGAIGAMTQRRLGVEVTAAGLAGAVRRFDGGTAGVNVDEMPGGQQAFSVETGLSFDERCRTEVSPGELLLAGPAQGNRASGGLSQARGFDGD